MKFINKYIDFLISHVVIRYLISGGTAGITLLLLLYIFHNVIGLYYLFAATIGFIGAFVVSFTLHKFWTFKSHEESTHKQMVLYLGSTLFGLFLNTIFMYIFVDHFHIKVILSQIFVGFIVACFSFFISRIFVFKYKKEQIL